MQREAFLRQSLFPAGMRVYSMQTSSDRPEPAMVREQPVDLPTCPACGAPRLGHAWDCAKCGAVFDDGPGPELPPRMGDPATQAASPELGSAPVPPPPSVAGQARATVAPRSTSARRAPSRTRRSRSGVGAGAGLEALRRWVDDNKAASVIVSFLIYVGVVWLFGVVVIGGTDSPGAVKDAYRDVTGRPLPVGFGPAFAAHFVGRRLVVLQRPDQVMLVLYKDADIADDTGLRAFAERCLDVLEVPWESISTRTATIAGDTVEVPVLRLLGEGGPHVYLVPTATPAGGRAVEAVIGAPSAVLDVVDEMVRSR